jgi:hypothetical protein
MRTLIGLPRSFNARYAWTFWMGRVARCSAGFLLVTWRITMQGGLPLTLSRLPGLSCPGPRSPCGSVCPLRVGCGPGHARHGGSCCSWDGRASNPAGANNPHMLSPREGSRIPAPNSGHGFSPGLDGCCAAVIPTAACALTMRTGDNTSRGRSIQACPLWIWA